MRHRIREVFACDRRKIASFAIAAVALVAVLLDSPASAQDQPEVRIARLVERLGSNSYSERLEANQQLAELGAQPRPQLELAAKSTDAEVAARARELLRKIALDEMWLPSRVTHQASGATASLVLAVIGQQTGNRLLVGDRYGGFRDGPVDVAAEGELFWQVIDDFCRKTKHHVRPHYDTREPGLALVSGEPGAYPVGYAGPVRGAITGALRTFSDEFDYKRLTSKQNHHFRMNLEFMWEDRLRIVAYRNQAAVVEAVTDSGETLSAATNSNGTWTVAGSGVRQVPMELKLDPPPTNCTQLKLLTLKWSVAAIGDYATAAVPSIAAGASLEQDDLQLTIDSLETKDGAKHILTVSVLRERPLPDPPESLFQENRFELYDASDRPLRLTEQTNSLEGRVVRSKLSFLASSGDGVPVKLKVTYPRLRSERDLEIVFRDVPLPTARPK